MRIESLKKLAKKVKGMGRCRKPKIECSLSDFEECPSATTPTGVFALYVGEGLQRFVVPINFLSHPLFKILLEKAYNEFGFEQRNGLVVPCTVSTFQDVVRAVECSHGQFDFGKLVEETTM